MTILDRLLFLSFLRSYFICLTSMLSLYVVVDLFTNLDDFAQNVKGFWPVLQHILGYYSYKVIQIFDRLCEAIVLLAAMFTVAWMQRSNELLPMLSAGVSTRRVIRPVLMGACVMMGLGVLNQELVIPRIADALLLDRDDPRGDKQIVVQGAYDANGVHVEGVVATRKDQSVKFLYVTIPETATSAMIHLTAKEARYVPPGAERLSGGWLLTGTVPPEIDGWANTELLEMIDPGRFFLHTRDVDFEAVTRNANWFMFASTAHLNDLLNRSDSRRLAPIAVMFHMRLTRPIVGMLLVILGLAMILRDQTRHVFISAGMCLAMCAVFYGVVFACKHLGSSDYISPALAAWMPVLIFGPLAFALFDAIHT